MNLTHFGSCFETTHNVSNRSLDHSKEKESIFNNKENESIPGECGTLSHVCSAATGVPLVVAGRDVFRLTTALLHDPRRV